MTSELTFRWLTTKDIACWRNIRGAALRHAPTAFIDEVSAFEARGDHELAARLENCRTLVAEHGTAPVACISWFQHAAPAERHRGKLISLFVRQAWRRTGLAGKLIARVIIKATPHIGQLELEVNSENTGAIALYQRHGFRSFGGMPRATCHDGVWFDNLVMMRRLDA